MLIKIRHTLGQTVELDVSKCLYVKELRKQVEEHFKIAPKLQKLIYSGKILADSNTLQDLKVGAGHTIMLMERQVLAEVTPKTNGEKEMPVEKADEKMEEIDPDAVPNSAGGARVTTQAIEDMRKICPELADEMEQELKQDVFIEDAVCDKCKKKPERLCKECGCQVCGGKEDPDTQLFCEECQYLTHMKCCDPPLEEIPEGDYYCFVCKTDENIVKAGQKVRLTDKTAKMPSNKAKLEKRTIRDWGKGGSCTGRTKVCTKVDQHHFGEVPGIEVGMTWESRMQLSEEGIHRPPVAGIAGKPTSGGSQSIVLSGGYEDDVDSGHEFWYTGAGGRDLSGNKRTGEACEDQKFEKVNLALAMCVEGDWSAPKKLPNKEGVTAKKMEKRETYTGYSRIQIRETF